MKIKAPRLDIATRMTIIGSEPREFINTRGEIASYMVAICLTGENTFEVSWTKICFAAPVGDQKIRLRANAEAGVASPVTMRTFVGAKEIGYCCELLAVVATPDEAAASASAHAVH